MDGRYASSADIMSGKPGGQRGAPSVSHKSSIFFGAAISVLSSSLVLAETRVCDLDGKTITFMLDTAIAYSGR